MGFARAITKAAVLLTVISVPLAAQDVRLHPFSAELLSVHNQARDDVGVSRLAWNHDLAGQAQQWADHLAREGHMRHSTRDVRGMTGENLWMGTAGRFGPSRMMEYFVNERRYFRNGAFPEVSTTGNWSDVGHYTQVVWRDTREVGCAVARGGRYDFLVCRYFPAGNVMTQRAF